MAKSFGKLLEFHLNRGTRPPTRPPSESGPWKDKEFGAKCGVTAGAVRFWVADTSLPPKLGIIEIALFGDAPEKDDPNYREWRRELAEAYSRSKGQRGAKPAEQSAPEGDSLGARERLIAHRDYLSSRWRKSDSMSNDFKRIENAVKAAFLGTEAEVRILSVGDSWPDYHLIREHSELKRIDWSKFKYVTHPTANPDDDEAGLIAARYKSRIFNFNPARNEIVGLAINSASDYSVFDLYSIKFHTKLALIEEGLPHATISGGCLTLNKDGTHLLTHQRATGKDRVVEAGGKKHTFCGSMIVSSSGGSPFDVDGSLQRAAERETSEESGVFPDTAFGKVACIWWCETKNHVNTQLVHEGLDVVCLGARFVRKSGFLTYERFSDIIKFIKDGQYPPEGYVEEVLITPERLVTELTENSTSWFPGGIAQMMTWIAIGAPGATSLSETDCRNILEKVFAYHGV